MTNLVNKIITRPIQKAYHYLFEYDFNRISIKGQYTNKIVRYLSYALLYRTYVMITYPDCSTDIGQITKKISAGRFVLKTHDGNVLKIIDLDDIFRIDLA